MTTEEITAVFAGLVLLVNAVGAFVLIYQNRKLSAIANMVDGNNTALLKHVANLQEKITQVVPAEVANKVIIEANPKNGKKDNFD